MTLSMGRGVTNPTIQVLGATGTGTRPAPPAMMAKSPWTGRSLFDSGQDACPGVRQYQHSQTHVYLQLRQACANRSRAGGGAPITDTSKEFSPQENYPQKMFSEKWASAKQEINTLWCNNPVGSKRRGKPAPG